MPADKPFKTKYLSKELGIARLSFGDETRLLELLNLTPGSVSALGLIFDPEHKVKLLIDRALLSEPRFGAHPCINTATVAFSTDDLLNKYLPAVGHIPTYVGSDSAGGCIKTQKHCCNQSDTAVFVSSYLI